MEFLTKKQIESGSGFASSDLRNEVLNSTEDLFFHVAFTDYGGSIMDKIYFEYFTEKYPNNIISEETSWYGGNGFIHCKGLDIDINEFQDRFESYLLFFEDIEEYFYNKEYQEKYEAFIEFIKDAIRYEDVKPTNNCFNASLEIFESYSNLITSGIDYSTSTVIDKLLIEGLFIKS